MNKRTLSMILAIIIMLSQLNIVFANETGDYEKSWAKNDIIEWLDKKYITKYEDGTFKPKQNITRGEFIQTINRAFDIPDTEEIFDFGDIDENNSYYKDIQKGRAYGYIDGYPDGSFKADGYITREEASKVIGVMLGIEKHYIDSISNFLDVNEIGSWAKEYINFLVVKGAITGYPDRTFKGKNYITREEAVTILKRIHSKSTSHTGIEYTVIDNNLPVENANIKIYSEEYKLINVGTTDVLGKIELKDINPGAYNLIIEDSNTGKILSENITVRSKFITYREKQLKDSVKVEGLLVDQNGDKASKDLTLVFESNNKFITNVLDKGIIDINLLPNNKYKVYVKQEKLEQIGEISVENGNKNIGILKYNNKETKTSYRDDYIVPETPEVPDVNDKKAPVIILNTDSLGKYEDEEIYIVDRKLDKLTGKIIDDSNIIKLEYTVEHGKLNVDKQNIFPTKEFEIEQLSLLTGLNKLTIKATDANNNTGTLSIDILDVTDENSENIVLDTGDDDGDGLLNYQEIYYGTYLNNPDTDGDGLTDYEEIFTTFTDPLKKDTDNNGTLDPDEDFDNDGLTNIEEIRLNGDPYNPDMDFDGLLDGEERDLGTRIDKWDTDGDGLCDSKEIELGTDPLNPDTNGNGILDGDEIYTIERTPDLEFIDPNVVPTIEIDLPAHLIDSLEIFALPEDDLYLPMEVPGYIGAGYEFKLGGEFEEARLTFAFNPDFLEIEDFEPAIYYYDEEEQELILLENQVIDWDNHEVSVQVEHFSKYILLNKQEQEVIWEIELKKPSDKIENKPLDIMLVIDSSGSMSWNDPSKMRISTAKEFVDRVKDDTRVGVVDFDSYAYLLSPLTTDKEAVKTALNRIDSSGGTSLTAGIRMALDQLIGSINKFSIFGVYEEFYDNGEEPGEDGLDVYGNPILMNDEWTEKGELEEIKEMTELQKLRIVNYEERDSLKFIIMLTDGEGPYDRNLTQRAIDNEVTIFTVGLGDSIDERLLREIALASGGRYFHAATADDLIEEFMNLTEEVVDYYTDSDEDGLPDYYENKLRYGNGVPLATNPNNPDTDGDGLLDGEEVTIGVKEKIQSDGKTYAKVYAIMKSNPTIEDTDGDGFADNVDTTPLEAVAYKNMDYYLKKNYKDKSTITFFVETPNPDSRIVINPETFDVGHTFVRIDTSNNRGLYRGFYPESSLGIKQIALQNSVKGSVHTEKDYYVTGGSKAGEPTRYNEGELTERDHPWLVAKVYTADNSNIDKALSFTNEYNKKYNMVTNNCTTFAVNALQKANIVPPTNVTKWQIPDSVREIAQDTVKIKWIVDRLESGLVGYSPANAAEDIKESNSQYLLFVEDANNGMSGIKVVNKKS